MVNLVGHLGIEVAERIVGEGREMNDCIKTRQVSGLDVTNVELKLGNSGLVGDEL